MQGRPKLALLFGIAGGLGASACIALFLLLRDSGGADPLLTLAVSAAALSLAVAAVLWRIVDRGLLRPIAALAGETRMLAHRDPGTQGPLDRYAVLAPLPQAISEMADILAATRQDIDQLVATSTARTEGQKEQLAAVLRDLDDGVLVCNLCHQVLLYNQAALRLLHLTGDLGIGRGLLPLVAAAPLLHTLERLTRRYNDGRHREHPRGVSADFVTATADGRYLLQGTMSLIVQDGTITGYTVTFSDATTHLKALGRREALLRAATEGFRAPIANLRAAAETLHDHADLPTDRRQPFEEILMRECQDLTERLEAVTAEYRNLIIGGWPMNDIHSNNLINLVIARTTASRGLQVMLTGLPQWVHGDSHSLVIMLDHLIGRLAERTGATAFDLAAEASKPWVFIDISWAGPPVPSGILDGWMEQPLADALGGLTVGDVLQHHRSDLWSEAAGENRSRLRIPLPPAVQPHGPAPLVSLPSRPEFFDFDLLHQPLPAARDLGRTPLKDLSFVVFDTETTGLSPSGGDEILAIAGVRIVNGRILTGEIFNQLVNPGRPIPKESIRFHGITEAMVQDKPGIDAVLPPFKTFVADAVLVAHNAAFDLKFLRMRERSSGVRFDNPVLDTMLLSRQLQGDEGRHALDAIAERLGIEVVDRHTALGDALLTAAIFLRFIDMLAQQGIHTLDDAIRSTNMQIELQARERSF